jgi:lipopolysaccharide transport system ATP-binding protein
MQVRLAFSVAIQADAGILLMDEVLAVGDVRFQERCLDVFNRYKREGRTVVLVTHDLGSVELYCDGAFLLDHGRLVAQGAAGQVCAAYRRMVGAQQDAEAAAAHPADSASEPPPQVGSGRWGSGEVRVTEVEFLGADGNRHHTFTAGQPMTMRIHCLVHRAVEDLICGVYVHRGDGYVLGGDNTFFSGLEMRDLREGERFTVDYVVDELRLLGGQYRVTVGLAGHPTHRHIDQVEQAFEFSVMSPSPQWGLFSLGGRWRGDLLRPLNSAALGRFQLATEFVSRASEAADQQKHSA